MKDLKYLASYTIPIVAMLGLVLKNYWAFLTPVYAFVLVPILEIALPIETSNLSEEKAQNKASNRFFDFLLYLNLPIVYGLLSYFFMEHYSS